MPRAPRIEYCGAVYHVMSRGDRRKEVFVDREDRKIFLGGLSQTCERTGWQIHAFVLMPNHFHLLVETPEPNLVAGMKWLLGTYTQRFNRRHDLVGHLFQGRYKALIMDETEDGYIQRVSDYIHLNPARAKLVHDKGAPLREYEWSSYPCCLLRPQQRPKWLRADRVLASHLFKDTPSGRSRYEAYVEGRAEELRSGGGPVQSEWKDIRRGWYLGDEAFRIRLLDSVDSIIAGRERDSYRGDAMRAHGTNEAEKAIASGMKVLNITEADLAKMEKGAPEKVVLAWYATQASTTHQRWLAGRLKMGSRSTVAQGIMRVKHEKEARLNQLRKALSDAKINK